ncbi:hypothetical protein DICVIV_02527 [Dictyocaulus viviparus]|uniref:Protein SZT2 n=1 Tax=Dictyocaulus viviparus TaxID=29172 RepID=A0A0D8Y5R4_DICVI|nr:hypothetical protein DICVIV_02527 [Dictyocaulus viviparus]
MNIESSSVDKNRSRLRDAKEIFIYMHRNFRVSRNIRAHWLFDHLNKSVKIEDSPGDSEYSSEMSVVGIVAKDGKVDDYVIGEEFRVCLDTKVTYISRYYRHVFVLDLSPSTIVADEENNCCLHTKLLECLRLSMASVSKSFTIPGTRRVFCPQIYVSVCVFIPFLAFEQDLVLVQGILLTKSNINSVLNTVTQKFNDLLNSLYNYSKGILQKWGTLKRRHRNKFDSACGDIECTGEYETPRTQTTSSGDSPNKILKIKSPSPNNTFRPRNIMDYVKGVWSVSTAEDENVSRNPLCDGYVNPEWALIFMLRLGLIAVQMMHENTQSSWYFVSPRNIIVITDAVCGMPDANALQQLLSQLRSYTVSCSFIQFFLIRLFFHKKCLFFLTKKFQLQGRSRSEACFGHVASCELFHFMAMATFGVYIPNCRCSIGVDMNEIHEPLVCSEDEEEVDDSEFKALNPFHRKEIFSLFSDVVRHRYIRSIYHSALHEILYIRLREGFTLKQVRLCDDDTRIIIVLSMPFRPLVFVDYTVIANWPSDKKNRDNVMIDLVIQAPYNELKDLLSEGQFPNAVRQKLVKSLRNLIDEYVVSVMVDCRAAQEKLHELLRELCSFCLVQNQTYVTFVYGYDFATLFLFCFIFEIIVLSHYREDSNVPVYFYIIKVTLEPPCLILRTAFLGGISSISRRDVVDANRRRLLDLRLTVNGKDTEALSVIRRPLERIMIRYRSVPKDLQTIVRVREDDSLEDPKLLILHNAISKYLECRRRIWNLPQLILTSDRTSRSSAEYILSVLMQRRLEEGFRVAWARSGIVGFCRQVIVQSGPALQQYVIFPPTKADVKVCFDRERLPSVSETWTTQRTRLINSPTNSFRSTSHKTSQKQNALFNPIDYKAICADEDISNQSDSRPLVLIAESWSEPCAICESKVLQRHSRGIFHEEEEKRNIH